MSSTTPTAKRHKKPTNMTSYAKPITQVAIAMVLAVPILSSVGCSTTQELKPTASVIVGGHKSI
ncbi:hypothetical protein J3492_03090 [Psychrobacter sp. F1192]|uniref:Uncharacterized protein n=1 Tax=Psychrobacter coccoides TaxID=2818440 RepID=A0ABS3NLB1_9GAMM|nr:hypothetical protein [Psychrobacter coccoides]MBO1530197.1 hypothetical protein [Psychrobacter coccoides]